MKLNKIISIGDRIGNLCYVAIAFLILVATTLAFGSIPVMKIDSDITTSQVWNNKTAYHVTTDIDIKALLVIEPGTRVIMAQKRLCLSIMAGYCLPEERRINPSFSRRIFCGISTPILSAITGKYSRPKALGITARFPFNLRLRSPQRYGIV